jgi:hypothetical protein
VCVCVYTTIHVFLYNTTLGVHATRTARTYDIQTALYTLLCVLTYTTLGVHATRTLRTLRFVNYSLYPTMCVLI